MKKILLVLFLFAGLINAQGFMNVPIDSGYTASDTVTVPVGNVPYAIVLPNGVTDSLYVFAGYAQGGTLYQVYNEDGTAYLIKSDTSKSVTIPFIYDPFESYRYFSFHTASDKPVSNKNIILIYKEE